MTLLALYEVISAGPATPEIIEQRQRLAEELRHFETSRGFAFWFALVVGILLSVVIAHRVAKFRGRSAVAIHAAYLILFSAFLWLWIRLSNTMFEVGADFVSEFTHMAKFRIAGILLSNPFGAILIASCFLFAHPLFVRSLYGGNERRIVVSVIPSIAAMSAAICYSFYLLLNLTS